MEKDNIQAVKVLRGCSASGVSLGKDVVALVPGELSLKDAEILIKLGKAEAVAAPVRKVKKDKDAE